jgi:hypothetical protein
MSKKSHLPGYRAMATKIFNQKKQAVTMLIPENTDLKRSYVVEEFRNVI